MNTHRAEHILSQKETLKELVVSTATQAFFAHGIKNVKMDDIAQQLKISKRTLYQLFAYKEELLVCCIEHTTQQRQEELHRLCLQCDNVLEIILYDFKKKFDYLKQTSSSFLEELARYPRVLQKMEETRIAQREYAERFLRIGVDQGLFLPEVNFTLLYDIMTFRAQLSNEQSLLDSHNPYELFLHAVFYFLRGFTTEKGARMMDNFLTGLQQE